ncbi:MAG: exo-alpha-sialidase [Verrucomicrobia bacterium]|nr:exo-alpha-sialidase [Verrucomicrobiota bacterium]
MRCAFLIALVLAACGEVQAVEPLFETTCVFPATPNNKPNYRIPAILQAPNGDLLIFAEKRNDGPGDVGNTDIVLKRSSDKGHTWSAESRSSSLSLKVLPRRVGVVSVGASREGPVGRSTLT